MIGTLTGEATRWVLFDHERAYGTVQNLPFKDAQELIMAHRFNGETGRGSQRDLVDAHVKKLRKEMAAGEFTPTNTAASCSKKHRDKLVVQGGRFTLEVDSDDPLTETDGGHRYGALCLIRDDLKKQLADAPDAEDADTVKRWLDQVENLPVTVTVYFDGDAQKDFVKLQAGKTVDATHVLSLRVKKGLEADPAVKLAFDTAKVLNNTPGSPFHGYIRFDSRGALPLPINTLCARGASDIATSLVGLARVGMLADQDAEWLAGVFMAAYQAVEKQAPELLKYGRVLTPVANEGKKGQSTMLCGLATMLAFRLVKQGRTKPTPEDLFAVADAARETMRETVVGNFSGPLKRTIMGAYAANMLRDLDVPKHDSNGKEIPVDLIKCLSASTFAVEPLPKAPKQPKDKTKQDAGAGNNQGKDVSELPPKKNKAGGRKKKDPAADADGPVTVTTEPVPVPAPTPGPDTTPVESPAADVPSESAGDGDAPWDTGETVGETADGPWSEVQG